MKRDDLTGFGGGGNKGRKLEFLIYDILEAGATRVVSCGSLQSNFVRQLGAACAVHGVACTAVVMRLPYEGTIGQPEGPIPGGGGNETLDALFGVDLRLVPDGPWETLFAETARVAGELRATGETVYEVPIGGSSPLGAYAFALAAEEVCEGWDWVVTPCSSGSTHAGLAWAFAGTPTRVVGIACDPEEDLRDDVARLCAGIDEVAGEAKGIRPEEIDLRYDWVGRGYSVPSEAGEAATRVAARREGLLLDPVYSAKAFAGLLDLLESGEVSGHVLFWHTGGLPTLLAGRA